MRTEELGRKEFAELKKLFGLLARNNTARVLSRLHKQPEGKWLNVTEIFCLLQVEQSEASQSLAALRDIGVVDSKRDGKFIYYKINKLRCEDLLMVYNLCFQKS